MEPKLNGLPAHRNFPPEPKFHEVKKEKKLEAPRIVPAELQDLPLTPRAEESSRISPREELVSNPEASGAEPTSEKKEIEKKVEAANPEPLTPKAEHDTPFTATSTSAIKATEARPAPTGATTKAASPKPVLPPELQAYTPKNPKDLLTQLSKDLNDLSKPKEMMVPGQEATGDKVKETIGEKAEEGVESEEAEKGEGQALRPEPEAPQVQAPPPFTADQELPRVSSSYEDDGNYSDIAEEYYPYTDDLGDQEEPSSTPPILKSIFLLLCLGAIIVGAWQVCLLLQPSFMQSKALGPISQQSCKYLYCPPLRPLRVLDEEMNAVGPGEWVVSFMVMNHDMRPQNLPQILLTVESVNRAVTTKVYGPSDYTVIPKETSIQNGTALKFQMPFSYGEGRPAKFTVSITEPGQTQTMPTETQKP